MKARIKYIKNSGDIEKERVVIAILEDCNIGEFMMMNTKYKENMISTKLRNTYWFPDKHIEKGDLVVLFTRHGTPSEKVNSSENKSHFFYRDLSESILNANDDCAVLFKIEEYYVKEI